MSYEQEKKNFQNLVKSITKYNNYDVFRDFVFMFSYAMQQIVEYSDEIEKKFCEIENRYTKEERESFAEMCACVSRGLTYRYGDFLGECFMELELNSKERGQFFTPYHLCMLMAELCGSKEKMQEMLKEKDFISVLDPACGGGALPIAYCDIAQRNNINFQKKILIICQDLDERCARMCHIQLYIIGASAIIRIGDTLKQEVNQELKTLMFYANRHKFEPIKQRLDQDIQEKLQKSEQLQLF